MKEMNLAIEKAKERIEFGKKEENPLHICEGMGMLRMIEFIYGENKEIVELMMDCIITLISMK